VVLRTGYVLTPDSLASQVAQFRRHFGAWIGTGRGWTPWIHIDDSPSWTRRLHDLLGQPTDAVSAVRR
jgi:NAD dependent epimerase/dehydratase family enzyme